MMVDSYLFCDTVFKMDSRLRYFYLFNTNPATVTGKFRLESQCCYINKFQIQHIKYNTITKRRIINLFQNAWRYGIAHYSLFSLYLHTIPDASLQYRRTSSLNGVLRSSFLLVAVNARNPLIISNFPWLLTWNSGMYYWFTILRFVRGSVRTNCCMLQPRVT